jgi:hypothetical protein
MWLAFFLNRYKWYQSNFVTPCDAEELHDVGPNEDVKNLSGVKLWHPRKLVPHWEDKLSTWSGWIIKELMSAKFHIGFLLSEIRFKK